MKFSDTLKDTQDEQGLLARLHSRYWLKAIPTSIGTGKKSLVSMASYQRAIAQFVGINSGNTKIPVVFSTGQQSYTDMQTEVVLSTNIDNKEFDAAVGLALHESNHILSTQKELLKKIETSPLPSQFEGFVETLNYTEKEIKKYLFHMFNFIEDRRVDKLGWDRAPGYRPYYTALYKKYFGNAENSLALKSTEYRENDLKSYYFRVINIMHPDADLDALLGLQYIYELMDLDNIGRLVNSYEAYEVGRDILEVIFSNIVAKKEEDEKGDEGEQGEPDPNNLDNPTEPSEESGKGKGEDDEEEDSKGAGNGEEEEEDGDNEEEDSKGAGEGEDEEDKEDKEGGSEGEDKDEGEDEGEKEDKPEPKELTKKEKEKVEEAFKKLKEFIDGEIEKGTLDADDIKKITNLQKANADYEYAQGDHKTGMPVFVIRHMTLDILKSLYIGNARPRNQKAVDKGTKLGRQLVRKLQLRNEVKIYRSKRKRAGQIDRRLLHAIGVGSTSIFEQVRVDEYGKALVHISIDASGSMDGDKWDNTIVATTALSYCATKIKNFDVVVDMRYTHGGGYYSTDGHEPVVAIMFDSRKDSFAKVATIYAHTDPNGLTPEGLCFEAIMNDILAEMKNKNGYFINFSDGEPNITNNNARRTSHLSPEDIAKYNVQRMRNSGIKILSFFIEGYGSSLKNFKYMYGKDAKAINTSSIVPLARELNKLFSETK